MNDQSTSIGPTQATPDGYAIAPATVVVAQRPAQARWARVGLLGIGVAAILAAAILVFGSSASPLGTLAAGTDDSTTSTPNVITLHGGGPGFGRGFGGGIEITAVDGTSLSLETADGWTRTITVDDGTTYSESGDDIALGDLAVGDEIVFRQTLEDDGTWTIDAVAVILPHAGGEVTAVDGSAITVEQRDGTSTTINVDGATEYRVNGEDATLADVEVGMFLIAEGTENSDGSLNATDVRAAEKGLRGPGGRGGHGFKLGGPGPFGENPDATESPAATDSAS
jgi:hypothetical protein